MNKQEFFDRLRKGLAGLPQEDIEECLAFYGEMLDDRMEEGLSEEEAVRAVGSVDDIVAQTVADTPLSKIAKERMRPKRRFKAYEIVLLALGSPIWLTLGIAAFAVVIALYAVVWAVVVSLWLVFAALAACFLGGVASCVAFIVGGNAASGLALLAAGFVCAGLAIFMFFGCRVVSSGALKLTKKIAMWIKSLFIRKEAA